jgi:hypothetical protein
MFERDSKSVSASRVVVYPGTLPRTASTYLAVKVSDPKFYGP